jgi:hypothetical protein
MIDYARFCQIKHLHVHEGLNASQIAQTLTLDPRTVAYWLAQEHFRPRKPRPRRSKLDPFGFVKLLRLRRFSGERVSFPGPPRPLGSPLRSRHFGPTLKSVPHFLAILQRGQQMTSRSEVLGNRTVRGEKPLRMSR